MIKCENCQAALSPNWGLKLCPNCMRTGMTDTTRTPQPIDEAENWLLTAPEVQHTLKLVPQSQRELFAFEMAKHIASYTAQAVTAALKRVDEGLPPRYDTRDTKLEDGFEHDVGFNTALDQAHQAIANELSKWKEK